MVVWRDILNIFGEAAGGLRLLPGDFSSRGEVAGKRLVVKLKSRFPAHFPRLKNSSKSDWPQPHLTRWIAFEPVAVITVSDIARRLEPFFPALNPALERFAGAQKNVFSLTLPF